MPDTQEEVASSSELFTARFYHEALGSMGAREYQSLNVP